MEGLEVWKMNLRIEIAMYKKFGSDSFSAMGRYDGLYGLCL